MEQLLAHLVGDYWLQSMWMGVNKSKKTSICLFHCALYTLPFLFLTTNSCALSLIFATHFVQDRWQLARYFIWLKNHLNPELDYPSFDQCGTTGYYDDWNGSKKNAAPKFLTTWLYIITDNSYHLICNYLILAYFN